MNDPAFERWWKDTMHRTTYGDCRELFEKCWRAAKGSTDYRNCLDVAGEIAKAVEGYEGDDLLSQIIPPLKPLITELELLRKNRNEAARALDEALGDTDLPTEDDSPLFRAYVALNAGAD